MHASLLSCALNWTFLQLHDDGPVLINKDQKLVDNRSYAIRLDVWSLAGCKECRQQSALTRSLGWAPVQQAFRPQDCYDCSTYRGGANRQGMGGFLAAESQVLIYQTVPNPRGRLTSHGRTRPQIYTCLWIHLSSTRCYHSRAAQDHRTPCRCQIRRTAPALGVPR